MLFVIGARVVGAVGVVGALPAYGVAIEPADPVAGRSHWGFSAPIATVSKRGRARFQVANPLGKICFRPVES